MKLARLCLVMFAGVVLAACDMGESASSAPAQITSPTARPVEIKKGPSIPGRLLFIQDGNLYLYQGTATQQITTDGLTRDPAWAPDGSRIAYVRREESYSDLYMLNASGGLPTQITFNRGASEPWTQPFMHEVVWALQPTWNNDSSTLAFVSQVSPPTTEGDNPPLYEYPLAIYQYDLQLVGQRQPTNTDLVVQFDGADAQYPAWSPSGSAIAFVQVPRDNSAKGIQLWDTDSQQVLPYPGVPPNAYDPAWSPDGRWLLFAANVGGATDIYAIPAPGSGGAAVRLTSVGTARAPAWAPDSSQIAFIEVGDSGSDLWVMPITTGSGSVAPAGDPVALTSNGQLDANSGLSWGR